MIYYHKMRFNAKQLIEMSNAVRANALTAIRSAASGHIGIVLGAADIITTIYANFMRRGTDKFVLSAGHGSALLYSVLKLTGHQINDLKTFRKISGLPGHPEFGIDGVSATTGPLGQGVGNAIGMALGAKICKSDETVYCLCSDGDLMEGVAQESIAFAGRYNLNNIVLLWDDNGISIDGNALTDVNLPKRMQAAGWDIISVSGNNFDELNQALLRATTAKKPVFIQCHTVIGIDSSVAGTAKAHGFGLTDDELVRLTERFNSPDGESLWHGVAADASAKYVSHPLDVSTSVNNAPVFIDPISTRELSGIYLEKLISSGVRIIGGSADLAASTNAKTPSHHDITPSNFSGNFINYGVREHAMGAIMNGLSLSGLCPYGSTFLVFSDYLRPSIRLAALSRLPVIYVFTHDSIAVGEDGPTHQPIEQLPSLRLMPNLNVFRPCNGDEVAWSWNTAIASTNTPSCIILSRQKVAQINTNHPDDINHGGYIIRPGTGNIRATIIATGTEVALAVQVAEILGTGVQVVSMPSIELFRTQNDKYKQKILRGYIIAIEAAATAPWFEFADAVVGIDGFGTSGAGRDVYSYFGFDADTIARDIEKRIK